MASPISKELVPTPYKIDLEPIRLAIRQAEAIRADAQAKAFPEFSDERYAWEGVVEDHDSFVFHLTRSVARHEKHAKLNAEGWRAEILNAEAGAL